MAIAEFFYPALYAVIPQLVSKDELRTANSLFELPQNVLRLSGYAIAGKINGAQDEIINALHGDSCSIPVLLASC